MNKIDKKYFLIPSLVAIFVFILCVSIVYLSDKEHFTASIYVVSGIYGFICLSFLIFQLYAFFKAHVEYDESIEDIKFAVFEAEKD